MAKEERPEIYFHVGLGKTASTWLQNKVFGTFEGVQYIHPTHYARWRQAVIAPGSGKVLISREMDQQLEREVSAFASVRPDTHAIIVMRSNAQWIASQYRRFLKNGYCFTFDEFFDVEQDTGFWKRDDVYLFPKLEILHRYFTYPPLVLTYDQLRDDPKTFIQNMTDYIGTTCDLSKISFEKHHASYSEKQLKWMLTIGKYLFSKKIQDPSLPRWRKWIRRRPRMWMCYLVLYSAYLIPNAFISKKPLIPKQSLDKINAYYAQDWQRVGQWVSLPRR
jgi:hypothetical protein